MKRLALVALLLLVGCEGKQGPTGPQGPSGAALKVQYYTGVLSPDTRKIPDPNYMGFWDINIPNLDNALVNVYTRQGSGYMWETPYWMGASFYVRIIDDDKVAPGDEYKIVVSR